MTEPVVATGEQVYWRYGRKRLKAEGEIEFKSSYLTVEDAENLKTKLGQEWLDNYLREAKRTIDAWAEEVL